MTARDDEEPQSDQSRGLSDILSTCRAWRRSPGGLPFVAVPIAPGCFVDWAGDSAILARWIKGKCHNAGVSVADVEISAAIAALIADPAREIEPPSGARRQASERAGSGGAQRAARRGRGEQGGSLGEAS
jgi:hypothetical protein